MKSFIFFLILVFSGCSSDTKYEVEKRLYGMTGSGKSDVFLYFKDDSAHWMGDLFNDNTAAFAYRIKDNSLYLIYRNNNYDQLTIHKDELIFKPGNDRFSRLVSSKVSKELKFKRVSGEEQDFLFRRIKLFHLIRASIVADLRGKVSHPDNFLYHDLKLHSDGNPLEKNIPDLGVSVLWWNTLTGQQWQWGKNTYHISIHDNEWKTETIQSTPVDMREVIHP